ncbi:MAG: CPBP family intramembrane metalloprotease [Bacteroidia bacterium]|nr:CPBP family intramembrane metalloprotease [Bacteroidia bacterium]
METPFFSYCLIIIAFLLYLIVSYLYKILNVNNLEKALQKSNGLTFLNLRHSIGILLFGVSFLCLHIEYVELLTIFNHFSFNIVLISLILIILTVLISKSSVKKTILNINYNNRVYIGNGLLYFIVRSIFLLSYEFFFRGVLLFTLIDLFGLVLAIIINTLLYVLIHAFDSKAEIIGAIPFGIVLCLLSYYSESIVLPFIIHLSLSLVYEVSLFNFFKSIKSQS